MTTLIQKFLQRPDQTWTPEDLDQLAQIVAGDMGDRTPAQWVVFAGGLLASIFATLLVSRIARKAIHETAPELEPVDATPAPDPARTT